MNTIPEENNTKNSIIKLNSQFTYHYEKNYYARLYAYPFVPAYGTIVYSVWESFSNFEVYTDYERMFRIGLLVFTVIVQIMLFLSTFWSLDVMYKRMSLSPEIIKDELKREFILMQKRAKSVEKIETNYRVNKLYVLIKGNEKSIFKKSAFVELQMYGERYLRFIHDQYIFQFDDDDCLFKPRKNRTDENFSTDSD